MLQLVVFVPITGTCLIEFRFQFDYTWNLYCIVESLNRLSYLCELGMWQIYNLNKLVYMR